MLPKEYAPSLRFIDFPPEIRNHIYRHVLLHHGPIMVDPMQRTNSLQDGIVDNTTLVPHLQILRTTQQIHSEAVGIFYDGNKFLVKLNNDEMPSHESRVEYAVHWLDCIGRMGATVRCLQIALLDSYDLNHIPALSLLRQIWSGTSKKLDVKFISAG